LQPVLVLDSTRGRPAVDGEAVRVGPCADPMATALSSTAGLRDSLAVSAVILSGHALFFVGQFLGIANDCPASLSSIALSCPHSEDMQTSITLDVQMFLSYKVEGAGAAAFSSLSERLCGTSCLGWDEGPSQRGSLANSSLDWLCDVTVCDSCVDSLAGHSRSCQMDLTASPVHMSYWHMMTLGWNTDADPYCATGSEPTCTGEYPLRAMVIYLIALSLVWPHLKLLLLHACLYVPMHRRTRRNTSFWAAVFGRFSLADVFFFIVLMGIMRFTGSNGIADTVHAANGTIAHVCVNVCNSRLGNATGSTASDCEAICALVTDTASSVDPAHFSGDLQYTLSMQTKYATYYFAFATVVSILAGCLIDHLEASSIHRAADASYSLSALSPTSLPRRARQLAKPRRWPLRNSPLEAPMLEPHASMLSVESCSDGADPSSPAPSSPAFGPAVKRDENLAAPSRPLPVRETAQYASIAAAQLGCMLAGISLPFMSRSVDGAMIEPMIEWLKPEGNFVYESFSLIDLGFNTVARGDFSWLLCAVFFLFVLVGPLLRQVSLLVLLLVPLPPPSARALLELSRAASNFSALEVMLITVPVSANAVDGISGMFAPERFEPCGKIAHLYPDQEHCFEIPEDYCFGYGFCVVAVLLSLASGYDGSPTQKALHRALHPEDLHPPPTACSCSCLFTHNRQRVRPSDSAIAAVAATPPQSALK